MAEAGEAWLQAGGVDPECPAYKCPPYGVTAEEWQEYCECRGRGASGVGSKPNYDINVGALMNYNLFDQPAIDEMSDQLGVAGHRAPSSFGLSRFLDFSPVDPGNFPRIAGIKNGKGWPNQDGLRKWWAQNIDKIVPGFCLNLVAIPCMHLNRGVQWCNVCPIEGLVYDIRLKYQGIDLVTGIDGSIVDGDYIPIPPAQGFRKDKNEVIQVVLQEIPPLNEDQCKPGCGHLEDWCFMISADVFCGFTGK